MAARPSFIARIVGFSCDFAVGTVLIAAVLTGVALWYATQNFSMTTDTAALISPTVDWRKREAVFDKAFPATNDIVAVIDGQTPELADGAAAALAAKLKQNPRLFPIVSRPDGGAFFDREGLLFLSTAEVQSTTAQLIAAQPFLGPVAADPSLRGVMGALSTTLMGVQQGQTTLQALDAPIRSLGDTLTKVADGQPAFFSWRTLISGKPAGVRDTRRFIAVEPKLDYGALEPGSDAEDAIHTDAKALGLDAAHGVSVRLTGSTPLSDDEFASLADRAWLVGLVMAVSVLVMLRLAVRSWKIIGAILGVTLAGLVMTAGAGLLLVGRFNLISVAFIPLFVGLGVDFGIQMSVRYRAERFAGADLRTALAQAGAGIGGSITLAAIAIAVGFFAFFPTSYVGISELGVIAGVGMIIALVLALTVLPAALTLLKPKTEAAPIGNARLAPVDRYIETHRRTVLLIAGVAAVACFAALPFLHFDFNPFHLRNPHAESMRALTDLMADPDRTPNTIDVLAANEAAAADLSARLGKLPEVAQTVTLSSFVPDDQAPKLAAIQDASTLLDPTINPFVVAPPPSDAEVVQSLTATADALQTTVGKNASPAAEDARKLETALRKLAAAPPAVRVKAGEVVAQPLGVLLGQIRESLKATPVTLDTLPPELKSDWVARDGRARIQVFPKGDSNDNAVLKRFSKAVRAIAPDANGAPISIQEAGATIVQAFEIAGALALVAIVILLFATLRSARDVLNTMVPVLFVALLTLGTSVVIGLPINFANIIALPLMFGVGVAFHIYFVIAWRQGEIDLLQSPLTRAVFFSALTTGAAFGSLWLSSHPGTASMGELLMISLAWTLVVALLFEPALLGPPETVKAGSPTAASVLGRLDR